MKSRLIAIGARAALLPILALVAPAEARNPHCAGGIQYVSQGMRDKEKGNTEDYQREMAKAVDQLSQCAAEDPADLEALGYLGWAYAEIDSAGPAGQAFEKAIVGLKAKGDKKAELVLQNREHYWSMAFNDGIQKLNEAQAAYPEFLKEPANDADRAAKADAAGKFEKARVYLLRSSLLKPGDPKTLRNLGTVYAFTGDFAQAEAVFAEGLKAAPHDSDLVASVRLVRTNHANRLIDDRKYDEAIAYFTELEKADPSNADLHLGVADAHFKRAGTKEGAARRSDFKTSGDEYAKASDLKGADADLLFNAALAYGRAEEYTAAEARWRDFLKLRADDTDAMSQLAMTLAEEKKFDEAIRVLDGAVKLKPQDKNLHRQFGGVYAKANNQPKSYEELVVYLSLDKGQPAASAADAAKKAPTGSAAAKTLAELGAPEHLVDWEGDGQKYQSWYYWQKNVAFTFKGGVLVVKSDWNTVGEAKAAAASGKH